MFAIDVLWGTLVFTMVYAGLAAAGLAFDARLIDGDPVWLKPFKFGVSTALYVGTVLWAQQQLSAAWQAGPLAKLVALVAAICTVFELVYIGWQAALGQHSHFNVATDLHRALYGVMALAAVALVLTGATTGLMVLLDQAGPLRGVMCWTVGLAFVLSTGLTIVTALTMGGRLTHHVGVEAAGAMRVPFFGWSLTVGDMRVPHFLATHLMQVGPLGAWLAARLLAPELAVLLAVGITLGWSALTLWAFQVVLGGRPWPLHS